MDERVPQHVQNLVIRDYCLRNNYQYLLSATEYAILDCHLIHEQVLNELSDVDGIVAYSLFQLPENSQFREKIYQYVISNKKTYHFAAEGLSFNDYTSSKRVEMIWRIKNVLSLCYQPKL